MQYLLVGKKVIGQSNRTYKLIKEFSNVSGYKTNIEKSTGF